MRRVNGLGWWKACAVLAALAASAGWAAEPLVNGFEPDPGARWHAGLVFPTDQVLLGDVDGGGKQDLVIFVREARGGVAAGTVLVALSDGRAFGPARPWGRLPIGPADVPLVADFDSGGKADIALCVRAARPEVERGSVLVGLSTGAGFAEAVQWHPLLCVGNQVPAAGDFNRDGRADIAVFVRDEPQPAAPPRAAQQRGQVWVALSQAQGQRRYFDGPAVWHSYFGVGQEVPMVGDIDGNGRADIITFCRGTAGQVYAAQADSNNNAFLPSGLWQDRFCVGNELPAVGDVDGDGRADLVTFVRSESRGEAQGDVYVALSRGALIAGSPVLSGFGRPGILRHRWFGIGDETCLVGDVSGDGKADLVCVARGTPGAVYVAKSTFGQPRNWQIRLENLRVAKQQERGGDEPYLALMPFRARFQTGGSAQVDWGGQLFELGDSLKNGAVVNIPERMGVGTLRDLVPITVGDVFPRLRRPEVVGAVVVCMESDGTPFGTVGGLLRRAQDALRNMLARVVAARPLPTDANAITTLVNDAQGSMNDVINAIRPSVWEGIGAWVTSFGDPDDFIGFHVFLFMNADPEVDSMIAMPTGLPSFVTAGRLMPRQLRRATGNAIVLEGDDAKYEVEASVVPVP
jgi:hypothetical protein